MTTIETMTLADNTWTREAGRWITDANGCDIQLNWTSPTQFAGAVYSQRDAVFIITHTTTGIQRSMEGVMLELVSNANSFEPDDYVYFASSAHPYYSAENDYDFRDDGYDMEPDSDLYNEY